MALPSSFDISQAIIDAVENGKRVSVDGTLTEEHSLSEYLELLRFAAACEAAEDDSLLPFKVYVGKPPGAIINDI